jgi:putative sterol carrier protein
VIRLPAATMGSGRWVQDRVEAFFEELGQRRHDPLLARVGGTGKFEVVDGDRTERWLVTVQGGYIAVSRGEGEADFVVSAERSAFESIIDGDLSSLAALIRGTLRIEVSDPSQRFGLVTRLFAGPPESRG